MVIWTLEVTIRQQASGARTRITAHCQARDITSGSARSPKVAATMPDPRRRRGSGRRPLPGRAPAGRTPISTGPGGGHGLAVPPRRHRACPLSVCLSPKPLTDGRPAGSKPRSAAPMHRFRGASPRPNPRPARDACWWRAGVRPPTPPPAASFSARHTVGTDATCPNSSRWSPHHPEIADHPRPVGHRARQVGQDAAPGHARPGATAAPPKGRPSARSGRPAPAAGPARRATRCPCRLPSLQDRATIQ